MSDERPPRLALAMWKRFAIAAVVIVALSAASVATAGLLEVKNVVDAIRLGQRLNVGDEITPAEAGKPQTILVIGSDKRFAAGKHDARSDTILLVRLDAQKDATAVLSIPRDLKVDLTLANGRTIPDQKINAAYAFGGPKLTLQTVKDLLGIKVNHVVSVNFGGFARAVNRIGCVYADIDHRYFNDNNGAELDYATIDLKPGYQKLCGQDALDYVRYRHTDSDLVRAARQQDFLRQAKQQVGIAGLLKDRVGLARIFGRYTDADASLGTTKQVLRLVKLGIGVAGQPIREVHFVGDAGEVYVTATPEQLRRSVRAFLSARRSDAARDRVRSTAAERSVLRKRKKRPSAVAGLEDANAIGRDQAVVTQTKLPFAVYYPRLRLRRSVFVGQPRSYDLFDQDRRRHRAYRMVLSTGVAGDYYGVQGTDWRNPPILDSPSEVRRMGGRKLELHYDGARLRLVAWRTPRAAYWVSNTLLQSLSERQMIGIATSLRRIGQ